MPFKAKEAAAVVLHMGLKVESREPGPELII